MRHCRLGDGAAQAVAELMKQSKTLIEPWQKEMLRASLQNAGKVQQFHKNPKCLMFDRLFVGKEVGLDENFIQDAGAQGLAAPGSSVRRLFVENKFTELGGKLQVAKPMELHFNR